MSLNLGSFMNVVLLVNDFGFLESLGSVSVVGGVISHRHTSRVHLTGILGSRHLAEKHENVSRLTSIGELAGMDGVCSQ